MVNWFTYLPAILRAAQREARIRDLATRLIDLEPALKEGNAIVAEGKALLNEIVPGLVPEENYNVEWIQLTLNKVAGEHLAVDGDYGVATHAAVKRFQSSHPPLVADGWVGLRTMSKLFQLSEETKP